MRKRRKCSLPIADNYADVTISFDLLLERTERPQDWAGIRLRGRKTGREGYFVIVRRDGRVEIVLVGPGSQEQILDSYTFPHTSQKMHFTIVAINTRISVALGGTEIMRIEADQYTDIGGVFLEACRATALFSNLEILPSPSAPPATLHGPLRQLTALIRARREAGDRPYTLLLGSSLSLTPEVRRAVCSSNDWEAFWTAMERLSAAERRALLASPLDGLNLAAGYHCLAQLVQASYFDLVFTLNVDDALDESLRILPAREYQILTHGQVPGTEIAAALGRTHPRVKVVKLHGDLNAYKLPLTPEGQFEFPKELEEAVERLLSQDTVLVGDISSDTDIQRCIRQGEGALWVVVPEEPRPGSFLYNAKKARPKGEVISGAEAEFVSFFSALARELGMEGPKTSMPSPKRRKLIEFTFMPPEPANYWDWLSVFRMITEEHRASGSWTDNNDVENRINRLEDFLKPFCRGQVYGASFALYSKDADGNFYEEVRVKIKPGRMLIFEVTDRTQAQKRDKLANIIRQEIDNLKGVRLISPASAQDVFIGDDAQVTQHFGAPLTEKVERGLSLADERAFLKQELAQHKRNLYTLREKAAVYVAGETPLYLLNQIESEEEEIRRIEAELERLER